jgi:hypothetical protein
VGPRAECILPFALPCVLPCVRFPFLFRPHSLPSLSAPSGSVQRHPAVTVPRENRHSRMALDTAEWRHTRGAPQV